MNKLKSTCDLYLQDRSPYQLSRRHCMVRWLPMLDGFYLQDIGSTLGTLVNGVRVGGKSRRDFTKLREGPNELILGTVDSPFRFTLHVSPGREG